ncbi:isochorismatase family protein [Streptomyces sp. Y1]|uniref:Isochorismatase family protein n=1 Tax=Streptomyces sp. Y1 TaxID=3238634 RepID=A0AB39TKU5_9ACTN
MHHRQPPPRRGSGVGPDHHGHHPGPVTARSEGHGGTDLYICGIATESCVLKTAVDAFERDLTPWLLEDAVASHAGQAAHEAGILVASRFIGPGQIIKTADIPSCWVPAVQLGEFGGI